MEQTLTALAELVQSLWATKDPIARITRAPSIADHVQAYLPVPPATDHCQAGK